jgi:hypothetical protein
MERGKTARERVEAQMATLQAKIDEIALQERKLAHERELVNAEMLGVAMALAALGSPAKRPKKGTPT